MVERYDAVVVGAGIVGLAVARELSVGHGLRVGVLERESRIAQHQSGRNSGVVHSGLYYRPGSYKARNCVQGRKLLKSFCLEKRIPYKECGKLVLAVEEEELPALDELERRGRANGLKLLERLDTKGIKEVEPYAAEGAAALWVGETAVTDFPAVAEEFAKDVLRGGGKVHLARSFVSAKGGNGSVEVVTSLGRISAGWLVNCAGLFSDRVARACGAKPPVRIVPFRGEYYRVLRPDLVKALIYPVPDVRFPFLGVHLTRGLDGNVEAGPNAVLAFKRTGYRFWQLSIRDLGDTLTWPGFWRMANTYWKQGLAEQWRSLSRKAFLKAARRLVPELGPKDLVRGDSGVRAQALSRDGKLVDDFVFIKAGEMVHVLNAPSPAATACIAIAKAVVSKLLKMEEKDAELGGEGKGDLAGVGVDTGQRVASQDA